MADATLRQIFDRGLEQHRAGNLREAESCYRQVLAVQPKNADALHLLGVIAHQSGHRDAGVQLIHQAIASDPNRAEFYCTLGIFLAAAGQLDEAIPNYRKALAIHPTFADASSNLGAALRQKGDLDGAIACYREAIAANPGVSVLHFNLGIALSQAGLLEEGIAAYRDALALDKSSAAAWNNLGVQLAAVNRLPEAITAYREALALAPDHPDIWNSLGNALRVSGDDTGSIAAYRQALAKRPDDPIILSNLAFSLLDIADARGAEAVIRRSIELDPKFALSYTCLGNVLRALGRFDEAIAAYRVVLALQPENPVAYRDLGTALGENPRHLEEAVSILQAGTIRFPDYPDNFNNLGTKYADMYRIDEAIAAYRRALELSPNSAFKLNNLANAIKFIGRTAEAIEYYHQAQEADPTIAGIGSNYVYTLHFHEDYDAAALHKELAAWNERHAAPLAGEIKPHLNDRNPDRRLRIAYVSPDFYRQAEANFVIPLLQHHDHSQFEIHCYNSSRKSDDYTEKIRACADVWHDVQAMRDVDLANQLRADGIDVVIDLTMHMAKNRLLAFARKPAPVQAAWLAYPGSTGLAAMDWRISDNWMDPPENPTPFYVEKTLRLPNSWVVYDAIENLPPRPKRLDGPIVFGSLNNPTKHNPQTLRLWAPVLRAIPDSRLVLLAYSPKHQEALTQQFAELGVSGDRIDFYPRCGRIAFFELFHKIDIQLDPLPYNGITTTCDGLWMGTPTVTLIGERAAARAGLSILGTMGVRELAAKTPEEFCSITLELAGDRQRLHDLSSSLRERMHTSPLCDAPQFARDMEAGYRHMWRAWCASV